MSIHITITTTITTTITATTTGTTATTTTRLDDMMTTPFMMTTNRQLVLQFYYIHIITI